MWKVVELMLKKAPRGEPEVEEAAAYPYSLEEVAVCLHQQRTVVVVVVQVSVVR